MLWCGPTSPLVERKCGKNEDTGHLQKFESSTDSQFMSLFSMIQGDVARTVSLFPRENNLTRIFVHFDPRENEIRKEQHNRNKVQLEDIQREAKRALLPYRLEFLGVLYWSVYVVGQRIAERMSAMNDRVFLCGDAAHCQSPTLGQGLNTGFGDVFNLVCINSFKIQIV